ncbi:MAG: NUDIX domain-containing protein [Gaiellaceae bacterium]
MTCKLVADVALLAGDEVLLVRYRDTSDYDRQAGWFLPDDFLEQLEHPEDAARRIARDQAAIDSVEDLRLGEIESFGNGAWHLVFHYVGMLDAPVPVHPLGNVAAAKWFALADLPERSEMAHHGWGLDVLERLLAEV